MTDVWCKLLYLDENRYVDWLSWSQRSQQRFCFFTLGYLRALLFEIPEKVNLAHKLIP